MTAGCLRHTGHAEPPEPAPVDSVPVGCGTDEGEGPWGVATETLTLALRRATASLGGLGALVHRWDSGTARLRLVASDGLAAAGAWAELGEEQAVAPVSALRRGAFVWVGGDGLGVGASGTAAVPVLGADGPVGVLSVLTARAGEPDDLQRSLLSAVAAWVAARLGGLPGTSSGPGAAAGVERVVRMGELTAALAEAVTSRDVVKAVAQHVLPPFGADGLVIDVFESNRLRVVGAAGYPQEFLSLIDKQPLGSNPVITDVLETRTPLLIESRAEFRRRYQMYFDSVVKASPKEAWAFLPMIASGRSTGTCVVSFARPRSFSDEEHALLTAMSGLIGQALERARLYDVEHARAQELQRGLLPRALPRLPVARAAARYLPTGRGEEVGGDWYDVIPLSAERVAIVIGDVMGHGIAEAATMGRLRTAVRTLADLDMPPDELLGHLNDLVSDLGEDSYATCLYAVFDPVTCTCAFSTAGHLPLMVVHSDGTVHSPDPVPDPPLGAAAPPFELHELQLPQESLLVLCTDGLVESPTRDIDQGLAQLRQTLLRTLARSTVWQPGNHDDDVRPLEDLCEAITSDLLPDPEQTTDDAALLIAHTRGTAVDVTTCALPDDPRAAGQARRYVHKQLHAWGLDDLVMTTELLASELVGNVVRHAKGPIRLRLLRGGSLTCEVYDGSLSTPRIRRAAYTDEGGRGLQLVASLSQRWGARYLADGKCIWTEQDLPDQAG